jgi:hypothetical protein
VRFSHKILSPVLPEFRLPGCDEIFTTFCFGSLLAFTGTFTGTFIAKPGINFVQWAARNFFPVFQFHGAFLHQSTHASCNDFITTFWDSKTDLPKHGRAMRWEVGVIKLTAKPASVLANKPQLREKTGNVA